MGFEPLERAAGAGAQLLRVDRVGDIGGEGRAPAFVLTFDVGQVVVRADPIAGGLSAEASDADDSPASRVSAAEEEPWWRIIGNPLMRLRDPGEKEVRLQFRAEGDNPRVIALSMVDGLVRAGLES